jgi:hypothetical protein
VYQHYQDHNENEFLKEKCNQETLHIGVIALCSKIIRGNGTDIIDLETCNCQTAIADLQLCKQFVYCTVCHGAIKRKQSNFVFFAVWANKLNAGRII